MLRKFKKFEIVSSPRKGTALSEGWGADLARGDAVSVFRTFPYCRANGLC